MSTDTDYSIFQTIAKDELVGQLSKVNSPRYLTFSVRLFPFLKAGLPQAAWDLFDQKLFLEKISQVSTAGVIVCLSLDKAEDIQLACTQLGKLPNFERHLFVIPRVTTLCQELVDQCGHRISVADFHLDVVALDRSTFIIPTFKCFRRCFIESDITDIYSIARALTKIQMIHGRPNRVFTAGSMASRVYELVEAQKAQIGSTQFNHDVTFDELFVIDRTVDLVTPLLTQFTYGGQLDDKFGIEFGELSLPKGFELKDPAHPEVPKASLELLDTTGEVYAAIRGMPMYDVSKHLVSLMDEISDIKDKMAGSTGTSQWRVFATRARKLLDIQPLIEIHLRLLERVLGIGWLDHQAMSYELALLDDGDADLELVTKMLNAGKVVDAIRVLCLASLIQRGVSQKVLLDVQKRLVDRLGIRAAADFVALDKCGLLKPSAGISLLRKDVKFETLKREFNLFVNTEEHRWDSDGNDLGPADVGACYDRYVPLLVRLVQSGLGGAWAAGGVADRLLTQLDVPHAVVGEPGPAKMTPDGPALRKVLVFVIGGVTESECIIFGQMGKILFEDKVEFHLGTTNITSGSKLIRDACPNVARVLAALPTA
jgi:hypothetical protein